MKNLADKASGSPVAWYNPEIDSVITAKTYNQTRNGSIRGYIEPLYRKNELAEFALRCLRASLDGCHADASDIQDWALELGLLEPYRVTESCGENCVCAEVVGFPTECYRYSDLLEDQKANQDNLK